MKLLRHLHKAPLRVLRLQRRKSMIRIRFSMVRLKIALAQEKDETRQMLRIYQHYVTGDVSKTDLARANAQLADVLRATGLGIFAVLPFAPITIPIIVKLGRKLGIEVLPSAFTPQGKRRAARIHRMRRTARSRPSSLMSDHASAGTDKEP
ncbi:hypothetical protein A5320_17970 [Rheinheimera sp. SA_1]|uniref:hypothetical protein n=1 Tax=Rheinheimera sp. SA_1 TaxID=1827365 RepID=UPI0007FD9BC6|nr:hypothetical protein [Rheinheimera sp. SA_1]OBP13796.1 hypothetical protein A5320_17970 [Rheinheimera sp. SA_1]